MLLPFTENKLSFRPGILLTLISLSAIVLFYALGLWQLGRAEEKKILAQQITQRESESAEIINDRNVKLLKDTDIVYRFVELTGEFEIKDQFFVDNKKYNGRVGYHVITPFRIYNTRQRILVNRGWIKSDSNRQILPEIITPKGIVTLKGQMTHPGKSYFRPGISQPADGSGGIWLYIDVNYFSRLTEIPLIPYILLLSEDNPYGYIRDWPEFKANTEMHIGYAIQWFAFAMFALLAYLSVGIKKHE